VDKMTRFALDW